MVRQLELSSGAPDHDTNCQAAAAIAVRHTFVPLGYRPLAGAGFAVTVPPAGGDRAMVSEKAGVNVAATIALAVIARQFDGSSAAPVHDRNCHPGAAVTVMQTLVPLT